MLNEEVSKAIVLDALANPEVRHQLRDFIMETIQAARDVATESAAEERLLTSRDAADLLGMTPAAVRQAAYRGDLPSCHVGRRLRFSRAALLALRG